MNKLLSVLHLEDNEADAELIKEKLLEGGIPLKISRVDCKEAFTEAFYGKKYDIILADRTTPTFDGLSALKIAQELAPETPFIFVSGTLDEELAIETLKKGAKDYVLKHRLSRLLPAVSRTIADIESERKQRLLEKQLIESQKMEGLGRLAGGIAHDFNNILAIIQCNSLFLLGEVSKEEKDRIITTIQDAVTRGAGLVKQLLTFAKKTDSDNKPINANKMVNELIGMLQSAFPKNIAFQKVLSPTLPTLIGDPSQIHQALLNLCVNARDAMSSGGSITIETDLVSSQILIPLYPQAKYSEYIRFTVTDTGMGMDEETLKHIFDPFFTTKEPGKGTGLGLAVVYGVVQNHQGIIDVESKKNRGTCFQLYFPIHSPLAEEKIPLAPIAKSSVKGTETILLIEDEEALSMMLKRILSDQGYKILTARDGLDGTQIFAQNYDKIDLVLSDSGLPKLSGLEVFLKLKDMNPHIKFILSSGFLEPEEKTKMQKAGIQHFILKPFNIGDLLLNVREALEQKRQAADIG